MSSIINGVEGKRFDCSECPFNQTDPGLEESCPSGLWVSYGIARCHATDEEAGLQQVRAGATIELVGPVISTEDHFEGGAMIIPDSEGLVYKGQYRVYPNIHQRVLARIGINKVLWDPKEL